MIWSNERKAAETAEWEEEGESRRHLHVATSPHDPESFLGQPRQCFWSRDIQSSLVGEMLRATRTSV